MFGAVSLVLFLHRIYGSLLLISSFSLETKNTVNQSKQSVIPADTYIIAGMNLGSALSV